MKAPLSCNRAMQTSQINISELCVSTACACMQKQRWRNPKTKLSCVELQGICTLIAAAEASCTYVAKPDPTAAGLPNWSTA